MSPERPAAAPACPAPSPAPSTPRPPRLLLLQSPGQNRGASRCPQSECAQGNGSPKEPPGGWHRSHRSEGGATPGVRVPEPLLAGACAGARTRGLSAVPSAHRCLWSIPVLRAAGADACRGRGRDDLSGSCVQEQNHAGWSLGPSRGTLRPREVQGPTQGHTASQGQRWREGARELTLGVHLSPQS